MAPTPTPQDIELPGVQGQRGIAGYDLAPAARGAQALAKGVETLGAGVTKSAENIAGEVIAKRQNQVENGLMQLSTDYVRNRNKYSVSNDPNDIDKWRLDNKAAEDKFSGAVPPPNTALGAHAHGKMGLMSSEEDTRINEHGHLVASETAEADVMRDMEGIAGDAQFNWDNKPDFAGEQRLRSLHTKIDYYSQAGNIRPDHAERLKKQAAERQLDAELRAGVAAIGAEQDPAKRQQMATQIASALSRPLRGSGTAVAGGSPAGVISLVSKAETGDPSLGTKALGNISRDAGGTKSYGFMGLNSGSGSAAEFAGRYGAKFGLRGVPGSPGFDAQWKAAALDQPDEFRKAQLDYFNEKHVAPVPGQLEQVGIPAAVATDPRVTTYFADRHVQMGTLGLDNAATAWQRAGGDIPRFLRNMTQDDSGKLGQYFPTAIATGVYGPAGHATRLNTRLNGALAANENAPASIPGETPGRGEHPAAEAVRMVMSPERQDAIASHLQTALRAADIDDEKRARVADHARKQQALAVEDEYLKDSYSANPTKTAADAVSDPRLEGDPDTKKKIVAIMDRANKPDPIARVSQATTMNFVDRMRRPEGDPEKLTERNDITDAYLHGQMSRGDYDWTLKQFDDARSGGDSYSHARSEFVKNIVVPQVTKTDIATGLTNTKANQRAYEFEKMLDRKKEEMTKAGRNPLEMFDPTKSDYMGKDEVMKPWRRTAAKDMQDILVDEADGTGDKTPAGGKAVPADPEKAASLTDLQAMVRQNPSMRQRAIEIASERGWVAVKPKVAPQAGPQVPPRPASDFAPQKLIDVEPGFEPDEAQAVPGLTPETAGIPVRGEVLTEPSKNIEHRGDYDILDKFKHHPLFDQIKHLLDEKIGTDNKLSKDIGVKDIDNLLAEAFVRTYNKKLPTINPSAGR